MKKLNDTKNNIYNLINKFGPLPYKLIVSLLEECKSQIVNTIHREVKSGELYHTKAGDYIGFSKDDIPDPNVIDALWIAASSLPKAGPFAYNRPLNAFTTLSFVKNFAYFKVLSLTIPNGYVLENATTGNGERLMIIVPNSSVIEKFPDMPDVPCRFYVLNYFEGPSRPPKIDVYEKGTM